VNVFQWEDEDLDGSVDVITDFVVGIDILNLSNVFVELGVVYDPQDNFDIDDFLQISGSVISLNLPGDSRQIVDVGVMGVSLDAMFAAGSILI
jgi:hypothetical protein